MGTHSARELSIDVGDFYRDGRLLTGAHQRALALYPGDPSMTAPKAFGAVTCEKGLEQIVQALRV